MREGCSKGTVTVFPYALSILCVIAFLSTHAEAQGADGRTEALPRAVTVRKQIRKTVKSPARIAKTIQSPSKPSPKLLAPDLGTLSAVINESGSQVYLSSTASPDASLVFVTQRRQSSFWRMLPPGRYNLTIKKPGFFNEVRSLDISPRGRHRLTINLRPEMAMLTITSSVADAEIEVERIGKFQGSLKKHLLKPGRYRVSVKRRGFVSETITADLAVPGKEQKIYVVLNPLRIDSILAEANSLLSNGNLDGAALLVNDVLLMNSAHARANMLFGFIELRRGDPSAAGYFLKAINGGETVSLPGRTVFAERLTDVQISIDRDAIRFRSPARAELNFRITKSHLEELARSGESGAPSYVAVSGLSDFFGRGIRPNLKIFSTASTMDNSSGQVVCAATKHCSAELEILFRVISGWREMTANSSTR